MRISPRKIGFGAEATMSQTNSIFYNNNNDTTECNINNKSTLCNHLPFQICIYKKTSMKELRKETNLSFEKGLSSHTVQRSYSQKERKGKELFDAIFKFTIKNYNILLSKPVMTQRKKNLTIDLDKYKHIFEDPHFTLCSSNRKKSPFETRRRSKTFLNTLTSI